MIIACPACTTGFNLPDGHLRSKGVKLRCSKCNHVFRVRLGARDEPEIFYRDGEEPAPGFADHAERPRVAQQTMMGLGPAHEDNPPTLDLDGALEDPKQLQRTNFGMPRGTAEGRSGLFNLPGAPDAPFPKPKLGDVASAQPANILEDSRPGFDALPSFGSKRAPASSSPATSSPAGPSRGERLGERLGESAGRAAPPAHASTIKLFDDPSQVPGLQPSGHAGEDLFEGAFGAQEPEDFDPFTELSTAHDEPGRASPKRPGQAAGSSRDVEASRELPVLTAGQPRQLMAPGLAPERSHEPTPPAPKMASAFDFGAIDLPEEDSPRAASPMTGSELIDSSFEIQGPAFDPQAGVIMAPAPATSAASRVPSPQRLDLDLDHAARGLQPAGSPGRAGSPVASSSAAPKPAGAPQGAAAAGATPEELAPHRIGGGGAQKLANLALIVLIVMAGFLGIVAGLNGGLLDFARFGHMIDVAFGGKPFTPRPEWVAPPTAPASEATSRDLGAKPLAAPAANADSALVRLSAQGTWAEVVTLPKRKKVLVVRGHIRNEDQREAPQVKVRVLIMSAEGEELGRAQGPIGAWLSPKQLKKVKDVKGALALLPQEAPSLAAQSQQPFTLIFDEVDEKLLEGDAPLLYRVELP